MKTRFELVVAWIQAQLNTDERGATMVEYGLLVALIGVALIALIGFLAGGIGDIFGDAGDALDNGSTTRPGVTTR